MENEADWIGSSDNDESTCIAWHDAPVRTFNELLQRELIVGATGSVEIAYALPACSMRSWERNSRSSRLSPVRAASCSRWSGGEAQGFCSSGFATMELNRPD